MEFVSTTSTSVLVNGGPSDLFLPTRGLRQGDPLSPYLFILCAKILATKLQFECNKPKSPIGCPLVSKGTKIPFLSFVDDIVIFCQGSANACEKVKEIIEQYCQISGQKVNYHKSSLQF